MDENDQVELRTQDANSFFSSLPLYHRSKILNQYVEEDKEYRKKLSVGMLSLLLAGGVILGGVSIITWCFDEVIGFSIFIAFLVFELVMTIIIGLVWHNAIKKGVMSKRKRSLMTESELCADYLDNHHHEVIILQKRYADMMENHFSPSSVYLLPNKYELYLDNVAKRFCLFQSYNAKYYDYKDIIGYEVYQNEQEMSYQSGNSGKALLGGLVLGVPGAIAGAAGSRHIKLEKTITNLSLIIKVNDPLEPIIRIVYLNSNQPSPPVVEGTERHSSLQHSIQEICLLLI